MAQVTLSRTYLTGDALPANYYNADRTEIVAGVNSIDNSQIASNAAIAESKLLFNISSGHNHDGISSKLISTANIDLSGLTPGQLIAVNGGGTALQSRQVVNADISNTASIAESKIAFDPSSGHIHDGVFSTQVLVANLDVTGLTPLEFVRVNGAGTSLETAPISTVVNRAFGFYVSDNLIIDTDVSWNPVVPQNMTATALYGVVKTAPVGADLIVTVEISGGPVIGTLTISDGTNAGAGIITSDVLTASDVLLVSVTQVGTTTSGADLSLTLACTEP